MRASSKAGTQVVTGGSGQGSLVPAEHRNVFTKELKNSLGIKGQAEFQRPGLACLVGGQHDKSAGRNCRSLCVCEVGWTHTRQDLDTSANPARLPQISPTSLKPDTHSFLPLLY